VFTYHIKSLSVHIPDVNLYLMNTQSANEETYKRYPILL
jgi:hypothetical protein